MKKTNPSVKALQKNGVVKKTTARKKTEEKIDLAEMLPKMGTLSQSESKKVAKAWRKAKAEHDKRRTGELFNPTLWNEETFLNLIDYLRLTVIDSETGYKRNFVPTQDYEQEVAREFRKR